jgi:branched-chain amino acid transport system ATP-binding protein
LLSVTALRAGYGAGEVLHGVDLAVGEREIVAIVGPNGAGKSTLMAAIMGLIPRRGGSVRFLDAPASARTEALVAAGLVLVPETRALFPDMSVQDNLDLGTFARWRGGARGFGPDLDRVFALFPRLAERRRQLAGTLSGGERQMLALGRALMGRPLLLLLDEPSLGLAPRIVRDIFRVLAELRREGLAILLVEQNARAALQLADHGCVLEMGEVVLHGPSEALAGDARVRETYLGSQRSDHAVG